MYETNALLKRRKLTSGFQFYNRYTGWLIRLKFYVSALFIYVDDARRILASPAYVE